MSSTWKNFKGNAKYGIVPTKTKSDNSKVPRNSFYESVDHVGSVVNPVRSTMHNIVVVSTCALTNIVLQPLYLAFAYLSYWPGKGVGKVTAKSKFGLDETESLVSYSGKLQGKAFEHSGKVADFIGTVLSYAVTAVIWAAALVITPLVWAVGKCTSSKVSEVTEPEQVNGNAAGIGNAPN